LTGEVQNMLKGHTNSVRSVSFSPDGRRIVSGSDDNSVRVWDSLTGEVQNVLEGHMNSVWSVAFSPDGRRIVSGSEDNSVRVWDSSTREVHNVLKGHMNLVRAVGRCIVSGPSDKLVQVWDSSTGEVQNVLEGHTNLVSSVAFSPDGRHIASGSEDNSVGVSNMFLKRLAPSYIREKLVGFRYEHEHTGWLLSPHGKEYLMFVPLDERLPDATNILTIPHSLTAHVNFTRSTLGP